MKKLLLTLILCCLTTIIWAQKTASWRPLGPFSIHKLTGETGAPGLGVFRTVDVSSKNPNRIIMGGMSSGVWLSEDKGNSWKNVTALLPVENVKKIQIAATNNTIVYASTTVGVIKSVDGGKNWQFTALNMTAKLPCNDREKYSDDRSLISVSPQNADCVVASTTDTVYRTIDGGKSWKANISDFQTQFIEFHPTRGNIVYIGGAYKSNRNKFVILRSIDGGASFEPVTLGLPDADKLVRLNDITAAVTPADPDKLYLLIFGDANVKTTVKQEDKKQMVGAFMVSEDAGKSFKNVKQVNNYRYIDEHYSLFHMYAQDEDKKSYDFDYKDNSFWQASFQQVGWATSFGISNTDANTMVMAASGAVLSTDAGSKWNFLRKQGNYSIHGDIQQVKIVGDDVWLVNDGGINYVNLKDRNQKRIEGYSGQDLWGFSASFKSDVMAVGVDHSGTMIYDNKLYGKDWYHYGGGDAMTATVNPFDDRYIYASPYTSEIIKRPLSLSDEPQSHKSPINFGYIPNRNVEFHPNYIYTIYGIDEDDSHRKFKYCRLLKSVDNLKSADTIFTFPEKVYGKRVRVSLANPDYIYVIGQRTNDVWITTDGGKKWSKITPDNALAKKYGFSDIAISDTNPRQIYLSVAGIQNEVKVLYSANAGQSWEDYHSADLPKNEILTMSYFRGTNDGVFLGAYPGVFYRSRNDSKWLAVGNNLPYTPVNFLSLNYDQSKIRIGTYRGIWECDLPADFEPRALIALNKKELPTGDFDGMKVHFYDHSAIKKKGAQWHWEFPGSIQGKSTDENPIVDYEVAKPGKYSVKLTITDAKNRKSSYELKDCIEVNYNYPWNLREKKLELDNPEDEIEDDMEGTRTTN